MKWTTELPTEPGWYWLREYGQQPIIVRVKKDKDVPGILLAEAVYLNIAVQILVGCEWAGPIPEPEE